MNAAVFMILCLWMANIVKGKSFCQDKCALEKAEKSLKLALGILKLVKDEIKTDDSNNLIGDDDNDATNSTEISTILPWNVTTEISLGEGYSPINTLPTPVNETDISKLCSLPPTNCADIHVLGYTSSGIYEIYPKWIKNPKPSKVYCDLTSEGGGWTVLQRRNKYNTKERQLFNKTWAEYKRGFGSLDQEFWIGNELIHNLTIQDRMILRLEVEDWEGQKRFSHFKNFLVYGEDTNYTMTYTMYYDSTIPGDSLARSINQVFRTPDNDFSRNKPAVGLGSGFWFYDYARTEMWINPNGVYYDKGEHLNKPDGIFLHYFGGKAYSHKRIELKIRPEYFVPSESNT